MIFLACLSTTVSAHCKKRRATNVLPGEESFNHKPLLQRPVASLPKEFNWNEVDGHSMLVPSWNQHIVSPSPSPAAAFGRCVEGHRMCRRSRSRNARPPLPLLGFLPRSPSTAAAVGCTAPSP